MDIGVIGSTGQLGNDLVEVLGDKAIPFGHGDIEIKDKESCSNALKKEEPAIVINCAAYNKVNQAENSYSEAFAVNAIGARNIAKVCEEIGAKNFYVSTDYIFDGRKEKPYTEIDQPNPLNVYGLTKYAGEIFTRNYSSKSYVVRVASLYGKKGAKRKRKNFVEKIIQKAKSQREVKVIDDIVMNPTYTKDVAKTIEEEIQKDLPPKIYHATNRKYCSWYKFAKMIFDFVGLDVEIEAIKTKDLKSDLKRPKFTALKNSNLSEFGIRMRGWQPALKDYLKERNLI
ncbi:dTDP-4-dehydrorhamnose reductase [candidate division MSBL1 archaeon SCGC-AAA382C18]|uniref:dTDP-4-dehydrorhamnose reductase n=1 Tax=candidate division MSBL1 archaeon SCGC-AAA382C18 TaxID=1698281 RepID=A0A133VM32_9EURY|nr:dTDP-4-dehydrorhamnose reductase [candidate division MSBL1 archaeon SCGC-AAA382C18]